MNNRLKHIKLSLVLCISMLSCFWANSQVIDRTYFSDSTIGILDRIFDHEKVDDGIIISGRIIDFNSHIPLIMKINTNGEVVWSTSNNYPLGISECSFFLIDNLNDGYIYGTSIEYDWPYRYHKMWKVDIVNGDISWVKDFYPTENTTIMLADYDSISYVAAYNYDNKSVIALMSKINGDTIFTKAIDNESSYVDIAVDDSKNIFFSRGNTVTKFNLTDLDQLIWSKTFPDDDDNPIIIKNIYLDQYDNLYLLGNKYYSFGTGAAVIAKVNSQIGLSEWITVVASSSHRIIDFIDKHEKIYATSQHTLVGGGSYAFRTASVDKLTGQKDMYSSSNVTPFGYTGGGASALSIDVDCSGDVYQTGYYGSSNSGPASWGIMKVDGVSGDKVFELTITEDSTKNDNYSDGRVCTVFGNKAIVLGHLEDTATSKRKPYYTQIDTQSGDLTNKKHLAGGYQYPSSTVDIIRNDSTTIVLKQEGNAIVIDQYDFNNKLQWAQKISSNSVIIAGQMKIKDSSIYCTSYMPTLDNTPPYYTDKTKKLFIHKLDMDDGDILEKDSIEFVNNNVFPFELEVDNNDVFIFYCNNDSNYYQKWNGSFSSAYLLEVSNSNLDYEGKLNTIIDDGAGNLLVAGTNNLFSINKYTLVKSSAYTFASSRNYHCLHILGDSLFLVGNDQNNNQLITALNTNGMSSIWEQTYQPNGTLYNVISDASNNLYVSGTTNNSSIVYKLSPINGSTNWTYIEDTVLYSNTTPYDLKLNHYKDHLYLAGANINPDGSSDVLITALDLNGDTVFTYFEGDEIGKLSNAKTIALLNNETMWVGGSYNTISGGIQGFIYTLNDPASIPNQINENEDLTKISVFPNPANNEVFVKGINGKFNYSIYDINGRVLQQKINTSNYAINVSELPTGLYLLNITQEEKSKKIKLIKH